MGNGRRGQLFAQTPPKPEARPLRAAAYPRGPGAPRPARGSRGAGRNPTVIPYEYPPGSGPRVRCALTLSSFS